jgi:RND family efflux transporter MFP subunit
MEEKIRVLPVPSAAKPSQRPLRRRRRLIGPILILVLALAGAAGWYVLEARPPLVTVVTPHRGPAVETVYATGVVEPIHWAKVSPAVKGRIVEILAKEGERVEPGTLLARLDDTKAQGDIAEAEARLRFAEQEVVRYEALVRREAASRQTYDRALSDRDQAIAVLAARRQALIDLNLRAPMAGIVLRKDGEVGEIADVNTVLFWIGEPSPLWITTDVDEEDIPHAQIGQRALIKADAFPGRVLEGHISEITPKGDPIQKTFRVRVLLPVDTPLMIGMTTEVNLVLRQTEDALLVPASAVRERSVFVVESGQALLRRVEVGALGAREAEIRSGLESGDFVVVDPPPGLADGSAVRTRASGD